ncbi:hypothetical protein [Haliangium ochraceum]|uniref:Lipoprotein n=1 Tax=Haliangium ochraceum (strain DSM 14365 / JCM 11303 / SMP-2) TaxID=502025 RepID=D0LPY8_HALO1|nr:hypothetical protein [Haliangium ochraceum]ACY17025.1 hypothetical protein Hoch_4532 [Haliangium ochraceum DSM 14365]
MKPFLPIVLLLVSGCSGELYSSHTHSLRWFCQSPEGCEREAEVKALARVLLYTDTFTLYTDYGQFAVDFVQRVPSDELPRECDALYGLSLFGHELESSTLCSVGGDAYEMRISVPNRNPSSASEWLAEMRPL